MLRTNASKIYLHNTLKVKVGMIDVVMLISWIFLERICWLIRIDFLVLTSLTGSSELTFGWRVRSRIYTTFLSYVTLISATGKKVAGVKYCLMF